MGDWFAQGVTSMAALVGWLQNAPEGRRAVEAMGERLAACLSSGGRILTCGNGGSMCDAMHFAEELSGRFRRNRRALPAQALSDPSYLTCVSNDWSFADVFARGVEAWGGKGDALVLFSTSGTSANIIRAAEAGRAQGMLVCGFLGRGGGPVLPLCDLSIVVPAVDTSDRVQEIHVKLLHLTIELIERRMFPENYDDTASAAAPA